MLKTHTKWKVKEELPLSEVKRQELDPESAYTSLFLSLCLQKGLETAEEIQQFLQPDETWIHDPFMLKDMDKAVSRIMEAIENGERITVYGDYDSDGVTSTAVLKETIEMIGGEVDFYIPNRFDDGYGPNVQAFENLISSGTALILTCDNGISGHEAIARANELGVDVIVTDHHEVPAELPAAYALIHPRHPEGNYPFGELAGVGVAFKLATALLGEMPFELLDLVAIGTIADLVSLTGENRALVLQGLAVLKDSQRIGIAALCKVAGVKQSEIDEETIGFILAPRLNAIGRLGDAAPAVELLTTFDEEEAVTLAKQINEKNSERQTIVASITAEAFNMIEKNDSNPHVYVLAKEGWHEGVLGIVASKVVGKTGKPAIVLNIDKEKGSAKGSGRSVAAYHLYHALEDVAHLTTTFGGHHMAAGLTVPIENIPTIQTELNAFLVQSGLEDQLAEEIVIDEQLKLTEITLEAIEEIQQLAPFGTDNLKPTFILEKAKAQDVRRIGSDQAHLKLKLINDETSLDVIGFQFGSVAEEIGIDAELTLVGKLSINEWNGLRKPQLMMEDLAIEGTQVFDLRSTQISPTIWKLASADYVFFDKKNYEANVEKLAEASSAQLIIDFSATEGFKMQTAHLILVDCPPDLAWLSRLLQNCRPEKITVCFFSQENAYLEGMPTRDQFTKVYKFITTHVNINVRQQLNLLADFLKIKENLLIFMISVFFEVGFVTIKDGVMNIVQNTEKRELTKTDKYKKRLRKIEAEEALIYSHFTELESWLKAQLKKEL